jgi:hypothetical protein
MRHLISRKKKVYPVSDTFREYLGRYGRLQEHGIRYEELLRYANAVPVYDESGEDTLWSTVLYPQLDQEEIHEALLVSYAQLKAGGDRSIIRYLYIDRVDLCVYGNTLPFRIRVVNRINENFDYFYVKKVDANRLYGLEIEHILSPNRISYFVTGQTVVETHIVGVPADAFLREGMPITPFDQIRLAKDFVKFNERCFVCLLGDMHSGNFVIELTRDFEKWHFRIHPIDFDQSAHHWRKEVYLPQYFPQNGPFVKVAAQHLAPENVRQYQLEERALIANRVGVSHGRFDALMSTMRLDAIAPSENVLRLGEQLAEHYDEPEFRDCSTMGDLLHTSILTTVNRPAPATAPLMGSEAS